MTVIYDQKLETPLLHNPALSNSLMDLAARFKAEHRACMHAMRDSVAHAIAAGEILIEAKQQLNHGQWLPWLKEHCGDVAERTAQLYMRAAKNRATTEDEIRNAIADLSLNEAMALLALSSNVCKLLEFARLAEVSASDPDAFIQHCLDQGIGVIHDKNYNVWHGTTEAERHEWHVFILYLVERCGMEPDSACMHVEWIRNKAFRNVAEWTGLEGAAYRKRCGLREFVGEGFHEDWQDFAAPLRDKTLAEITALSAEARWNAQTHKRRKTARHKKPRPGVWAEANDADLNPRKRKTDDPARTDQGKQRIKAL
jgi:hypothetical protein